MGGREILVGILETGEVSSELRVSFGSYGDMFEELISSVRESVKFKRFNLVKGEFPNNQTDVDLWVITGSKYGVYDPLPWIRNLKLFIKSCFENNIRFFGVCFGHQIIAEALGGKVKNFSGGWGLGVHEYTVQKRLKYNKIIDNSFHSFAIHQDQVTTQPKNSINLASSNFCKHAMLLYEKDTKPIAVSIQPHLEVNSEYVSALIHKRKREKLFPVALAKSALESLNKPVDNLLITTAILKLLNF